MTTIVPIPMFLPSPYRALMGCSHSDYAVREQTRQQASQHSEVMGALRDLRKDTITVCVLSAAIAPLCVAALARLEPEARDFDAALSKWYARIRPIREWQRARKAKRQKIKQDERKAAAIAKYTEENRRWWRSEARAAELGRAAAEQDSCWDAFRDINYMRWIGFDHDRYCPSRPVQPAGYSDIPAIRDLQSAASISPDAQLTVPVETIKKLARWSP